MIMVAFLTLGSGKTLSGVIEAYRYRKKHPKNPIYSNVPLNKKTFPNFKPIHSLEDICDINAPCFILLDEAWHMADSMNPSSPENELLGLFLIRSRKQGWTIFMTEQWYTQLVKRIRFPVDIWIAPQHFSTVDVVQQDLYDIFCNYLLTRWYYAKPFYKDFDSYADPLTLNIEEVRARYIAKKRKQLR